MTLPPAEQLAERLIAAHRRFYDENPRGQLEQMCLIVIENGREAFIPFGWRDRFERELRLDALRAVCEAAGAVRLAMWGEAWTVEGEAAREVPAGTLHQHPERREVVFTSVCDAAREKPVFRALYIERDRKGRVTGLTEMPRDGTLEVGGELMDLLPRRSVQ